MRRSVVRVCWLSILPVLSTVHAFQRKAYSEAAWDKFRALCAANSGERFHRKVEGVTGFQVVRALPPAKDSYSLSALSPALLPKLGPMDPKDRIDLYADPAIRSVDKMAQKDVTGPEASYQRSVKSLADSAKKDIADLQAQAAKLPAGSKERVAIEQKIDQRGDQFQRELESTTRFAQDQIKAKRGGEEGDKFAKSLPPYLQQCVKNKGVAIPGTNLGVVPRFDNGGVTGGPTGVSIGGKF